MLPAVNNKILELDTFNFKLDQISLIEASAGTGKTYAIVNLYLKAIINCGDNKLEQPLDYSQLLVVTFTKLAVQELKERIRYKLENLNDTTLKALFTIKDDSSAAVLELFKELYITQQSDPFYQQLFQEYLELGHSKLVKSLEALALRLGNILKNIESLPIYTIDKFISRSLGLFSLSNSHANFEMVENIADKLNPIIKGELTVIKNFFATSPDVKYLLSYSQGWLQCYDEKMISCDDARATAYTNFDGVVRNNHKEALFKPLYFNEVISKSGDDLDNIIKACEIADFNSLIKEYKLEELVAKLPDQATPLAYLNGLIAQRKAQQLKIKECDAFYKAIEQAIAAWVANDLNSDSKTKEKLYRSLIEQLNSLIANLEQLFVAKGKSVDKIRKVISNRQKDLFQNQNKILKALDEITHGITSDSLREIQLIKLHHSILVRLMEFYSTVFSSPEVSEADLESIFTNINHQLLTKLFELIKQYKYPNISHQSTELKFLARQEFVALVAGLRNKINYYLEQQQLTSFTGQQDYFAELLQDQTNNLVENIRMKYPMLMIDEFQDTSLAQFLIFAKIYQDQPQQTIGMVMIGDPKQSIYRFRGSDLGCYFKAKDSAQQIYTLSKNYRSNPDFIKALNEAFSSDQAFKTEQLQYTPLEANSGITERLTYKGEVLDSLGCCLKEQLIVKLELKDSSVLTKNTQYLGLAIAWMISEGKAGNLKIGSRNLNPSDIAVLSYTSRELKEIKKYLDQLGVNSNIAANSKETLRNRVFNSLLSLIKAVADFTNSRLVGDYINSELAHITIAELLVLNDPSQKTINDDFIAIQKFLGQCKEIWTQQGFAIFINYYIIKSDLINKARNTNNGEKLISDFIALTDWISEKTSILATPQQVIGFMELFPYITFNKGQDYKTRLSQIDQVVTLNTIHSAKGLEYPVVFMLYNNSDRRSGSGVGNSFDKIDKTFPNFKIIAQNADSASRFLEENLDKSNNKDPHDPDLLGLQQSQEWMRLFYVALSRAKHACYIFMNDKDLLYDSDEKNAKQLSEISSTSIAWLLRDYYGHIKDLANEEITDSYISILKQHKILSDDLEVNLLANFEQNLSNLIASRDHKISWLDMIEHYKLTAQQTNYQIVTPQASLDFNSNRLIGVQQSFSRLNKNNHHNKLFASVNQLDKRDLELSELVVDLEKAPPASFAKEDLNLAANLPSGPVFGTVVHNILELLDYTKDKVFSFMKNTVKYQANINGISDENTIEELINWLNHIVNHPIELAQLAQAQNTNYLSLKQLLQNGKFVKEWSFKLILATDSSLTSESSQGLISKQSFNSILKKHRWQELWSEKLGETLPNHSLELDFNDFFGYLVGIIDLLWIDNNNRFWIIDYKTNNLGKYYSNYSDQAVVENFLEDRYDLQMLLYTVALDIYLTDFITDYDYQLNQGGALYLYLRGMGQQQSSSTIKSFVHFKVPQELVKELVVFFKRGVMKNA